LVLQVARSETMMMNVVASKCATQKKNQDDEGNLSSWSYKLHKENKTTMMSSMFVVVVSKCATQKKNQDDRHLGQATQRKRTMKTSIALVMVVLE